MMYIHKLKKLYKGQISSLEDIYNDANLVSSQMTFNELIVQFHFQQLEKWNSLTVKNMMAGLPKEFHWIVKKHIKHDLKKVPIVCWNKASVALKEAVVWNWCDDDEYGRYIQLHSPIKCI